ncbi:hypothetical protein WJX72_006356 [[Myrmecia] bisecta]|uniref:Putative restriction endonuclease domain-containing protein n=1 Tax=[Myrmecia] bisecta TaxID=41462 RepID=A0AAW1QFE7_9CHLO
MAFGLAGGERMASHWEVIYDQKVFYDPTNRLQHDLAGWKRSADGTAGPTASPQTDVETHIQPDLAVETLSPGTQNDDLPGGRKWIALEAHGVPHYWIIHPAEGWIAVYAHTNPRGS